MGDEIEIGIGVGAEEYIVFIAFVDKRLIMAREGEEAIGETVELSKEADGGGVVGNDIGGRDALEGGAEHCGAEGIFERWHTVGAGADDDDIGDGISDQKGGDVSVIEH